jgi:putative glycosyltransferase (exosortase G-associated)
MTGSSLELFFFWSAWMVIPFLVDFVRALRDAFLVWRNRGLAKFYPPLPLEELPKVTVIIPAYNEQLDIDRCLISLKAQTYPHHRIEVIVINDGSTDRTEDVVNGHINGDAHWNGHIRLKNRIIRAKDFGFAIVLLEGQHQGKASAVNTGLGLARGQIIFAIDSDVVLAPEAIEQAVRAFRVDPELQAATAHLIVDQNLVVHTDGKGRIELDEHGLPLPKPLRPRHRLLASAQFLEYLQAFRVGRHAEAIRNELFTLSGACAIFRRDAFLGLRGYSDETVSEDTDATLKLHREAAKVSYLPQVEVHIAPTSSWREMYSQRVRWQRGELEVVAKHLDHLGREGRFWQRRLPSMLRRDHTLALLRMSWGLLLPIFPLFGYEPRIILQAVGMMYLLYLLGDYILLLAAWPICSNAERALLRQSAIYTPLVPLYRIATYVFRLSGIIKAMNEPPTWTAPIGWIRKIRLPILDSVNARLQSLVEIWAS